VSLINPYGDDPKEIAGALATSLALKSKTFWISLRSWMGKFYNRLLVKVDRRDMVPGQSVKDYDIMVKTAQVEAWELVTQVIMDIFGEFLKARSSGHPAGNMAPGVEQTAAVLFGTLRGHQFMAELLKAKFERHPCLSPSMNNFCVAQRASLGDMTRLEARIGYVAKLQTDLKSEFDRNKKK
jgi:hypothetical protein